MPPPKDHKVKVTATGFDPKKIVIKVGETVTWVNDTDQTQNVTFDAAPRISEDIAPGTSFNHTITAAGEHEYHSKSNPELKGTVSAS